MKLPFIIYADLEFLLEKMSTCIVILKNHQQLKEINIHPLVIHCLHNLHLIQQKNKLDYYRGKNCMKNFCLDLRTCNKNNQL